ncbi:MAG: hypothetical protein ACTSR8_16175 [Promethearchaeota archaeon]
MTTLKKDSEMVMSQDWRESYMERHDLYNFESKIDYILDRSPEDKKNDYLLEIFFFIPETLQINKESYSKEHFFLDLNNRIRFKTPQMSVQGILDKKNDLSPVNIILEKIRQVEYGKKEEEIDIRIDREIRLLACIIKVSLRDQFMYLLTNYQKLWKQGNFVSLLGRLLTSIEKLEDRLNYLREKFVLAQMDIKLRESFQFADEYISVQIKTWVAHTIQKLEGKPLEKEVQSQLIRIIEREQEFRRNINSRLILQKDSNNETFTYYESILKKYVQGVLYLEKKKKDPRSASTEILYSIAAGLAMFFSLFFGFLFLSAYEVTSITFIIGTVVIYMLKDRIKENVRGISNKAIGLFLPDKRVEIMDAFYKKVIGEIKEKASFLHEKQIPPEIMQIRSSSNISPLEKEGKPEVVLAYWQMISLYNDKIDTFHSRKKNLSNIIRFNIRRFLDYADDPIQYELLWNETKKTVEEIPVSRVYHINIILKMSSFKGKKIKRIHFKKFRVIFDQKGILRIEEPEISL